MYHNAATSAGGILMFQNQISLTRKKSDLGTMNEYTQYK